MTKTAILCIDDERIILNSLRKQLSQHFGKKYLYECAETVKEAWEVIEELDEDDISVIVVISDWLMPEVKGDEFLIQVHQYFPKVVTIMLTGQADEQAITRAKQEANLHSCLRKPWDAATLIKVIESGLEKANG